MRIQPEVSGLTIVLNGSLNPRIFTPDWFARNGLLTAREAEASEIEVIHAQITAFEMEWLTVRVTQSQFQAKITEAPYVRLSDLIVRTFKEFLPHTPLTHLGINREAHFDVGSFEVRNNIGEMLSPKEPWGEWAQYLSAADEGLHGGMVSLTMQQRNVDDRAKGYISARVEPSALVSGGRTGIFMQINDHYEMEDPESAVGCDEMIGILEQKFEESRVRSEWIIDQIMTLI